MGDEEKQLYSIILRHDTSTNWMANDPILALGEYGVEDDTHKVKRGNGESKWSEMPYEDFGLKYIVTFENLNGEVKDNVELQKALDEKVSLANFNDVNKTVISGILVTDGDNKILGKITKTAKDIEFGATTITSLIVKSSDNSIQGVWTLDDSNNKVLNLTAKSTIANYEAGITYSKNQLCYYGNKLYRAVGNFIAPETFNKAQWALIASLHSNDILYDNTISNIDADNIKSAIDELARRDSKKVSKSTESRIVYGTSITGEQTVYNIDDLRKVDTVNNVLPDARKNIQIDANKINYNDATPENGTIKDVLDKKINKDIAGIGAKIVKDVNLTYNEEDGQIKLKKEKLSLEDGTTDEKEDVLNVVSEQELNTQVNNLNNTITEKETTINRRIDTEVETLNNTINNKETIINERIDTEVETLNNTINNKEETINNTITEKETALNNKIDGNKIDIENKLTEGLNTKIDRDIADNIVTDIIAATDSEEPTLKIVRKNTTSEEAITHHLHFKAKGKIKTRFGDADHIIIDSKDIDDELSEHQLSIDSIETRLDAHDGEIAALQLHDVNHDSKLAAHTSQIALHETNINKNINDIKDINNDITDIKEVNAQQELHLTNIDSQLDTHTQQLQDQADQVTEVANIVTNNRERLNTLEPIVEQNKQDMDTEVERLDGLITNLDNTKINKTLTENIIASAKLIDAQDNLLNLKIDGINPQTEDGNSKNIILKSSDNTLVSTPILAEDGTITGYDLATNLDIDVNYFVTSEILNTTIPSDTTLQLSSLTSTDKPEVELQDIISDTEGTWARVKSINKDEGTLVCVTFHKHAQAVWGTVKGNIKEQTDLQEEFGKLIPKTYYQDYYIKSMNSVVNMPQGVTENNYATDVSIRENLNNITDGQEYKQKDLLKIVESDSVKVWNTIGQESPVVSFIVDSENVDLDPKDSNLQSVKLGNAIRELKTLDDAKLAKVGTPNIVYGTDETGTQHVYDKTSFGKVDTVNNIEADENKNITLVANDITYVDENGDQLPIQSMINSTLRELKKYENTFKMVPVVWDLDTMFELEESGMTMDGGIISMKKNDYIAAKGINDVVVMGKLLNIENFLTTFQEFAPNSWNIYKACIERDIIIPIGIPEQVMLPPEPEYSAKLDIMGSVNELRPYIESMSAGSKDEYPRIFAMDTTKENPTESDFKEVGIFDIVQPPASTIMLEPGNPNSEQYVYNMGVMEGTKEQYLSGAYRIKLGLRNPDNPEQIRWFDGINIMPPTGSTPEEYKQYLFMDIPQVL